MIEKKRVKGYRVPANPMTSSAARLNHIRASMRVNDDWPGVASRV